MAAATVSDAMYVLMPGRKHYVPKIDVRPLKGKGVAVSAQEDMPMGHFILAEAPIFTLPIVRGQLIILGALMQCEPEYQTKFYEFFNCWDETEEITKELGIFTTNAIPCGGDITSGSLPDKEGIFFFCSRINHSCKPNVHVQWVDWVHQIELRATRDIAYKDELCRSYIDLLQSRRRRQQQLMEKYWFKCRCEACSLTGAELDASDNRRRTVRDTLDRHFGGKCKDAHEGLREIQHALDCIDKEGLPMYEAVLYFFGFHLCAASGDCDSAIQWAIKAREAYVRMSGYALDELLERLANDPLCYPDANTMPKKTLTGPDSPLWRRGLEEASQDT
ncbi:hypothetical protein EUX98_g3275 [Antrodiella citrinella]|uniref:SET domain-containing protein n=1 Tax=Antrodiella citrinella TaxID=2447956 RepID=A0A4S4MZ08_9APHY|nr:hypothetical protein EUX98_g3275 [Antrodiella citrinella]